jgi:prepilin-type N-terminal cleavage/methylation domain-containing protein
VVTKINKGFTLVEMSIVLVVIGLILGAVSISSNLQRSAEHTKIYSTFIMPWAQIFSQTSSKLLLNPDFNANDDGLIDDCDARKFVDELLLQKMDLPSGRGDEKQHQYLYTDADGAPKSLSICFVGINSWKIGTVAGNDITKTANVMQIKGATDILAGKLDSLIDGKSDMERGQFRLVVSADPKARAVYHYRMAN